MQLYNTESKEVLIEKVNSEPFKRITLSFYRYLVISDPQSFRNDLFLKWHDLNCLGRIYVSSEGVNAQMSVPENSLEVFLGHLDSTPGLQDMPIKYAVEDDGKSFYKLIIKIREKIVADGLNDSSFDVCNVGKHLSSEEFHLELQNKDNVVVDMRNHYESEIGHFKEAFLPQSDTFREGIQIVLEKLQDKRDIKILLYCTGGVRCEKASAFLKHHGFEDVNQLHGGIIEYARYIKQSDKESAFIGKNFVFDNRLGESISSDVISKCHQCGEACDTHTNCANSDCHLLFIQCNTCKTKYQGCCCEECSAVLELPPEEQKLLRRKRHEYYSQSKIFKSRLRPVLMEGLRHSEQNMSEK